MDVQLTPLLEQANKRETNLYFGDAVHLIYGAELGYCWCFERQEVKSAYGRKRYNVMGCYNAVTSETITITNDTYITSSEIVSMFKKLRDKHGDETIHVILDNARYQKCQLVKEAAKQYNINVVYLPAYSPNLNLIERLWKWLRKKCLCNKYSKTFKDFCVNIDEALSKTSLDFLGEVSSLLTHNFQVLGA